MIRDCSVRSRPTPPGPDVALLPRFAPCAVQGRVLRSALPCTSRLSFSGVCCGPFGPWACVLERSFGFVLGVSPSALGGTPSEWPQLR